MIKIKVTGQYDIPQNGFINNLFNRPNLYFKPNINL